jgi:phage recombination protein Bet
VEAMSDSSEILRLGNRPLDDVPDWESKIDLIRRTVAAGATADELELFFHQARRAGLDPLAKQIYFVKRQGKGVIQVGIDGLRLIADRTGAYAGSDDAEFSGSTERGFPAAAKVVVYKMVGNHRCPFGATARWDEYFPGDQQGFQWKRMPHAMLAKCAEALALRKAFPADMSGLYVHEEMEQAGSSEPPTGGSPAPVSPSPVSPDLTGASLIQAAQQAFGDQGNAPMTGSNPQAFGYVPMRWPVAKMFGEPATESQGKMARGKARERMMDLDELDVTRRVVLGAFGLEDDGSKAAMSLFIDFLINADDDALDRASAAVEAQPRTDTELPQ